MEEQLISFKTAKLAKNKGFRQHQGHLKMYRDEDGYLFDNIGPAYDIEGHCSYAPTQSLLQKWLREKHEMLIRPDHSYFPSFKDREWYCSVKFKYDKWKRACKGRNSYEEALEHGLQKALKLI